YQTPRGDRVLAALDAIAGERSCTPGCVALAWLAQQPTVAAPLASARTVDQLDELLPVLDLTLNADELAMLNEASA
ncbi:MAG: aldo/keto reductase, partial [Actinomycetales bacterium]